MYIIIRVGRPPKNSTSASDPSLSKTPAAGSKPRPPLPGDESNDNDMEISSVDTAGPSEGDQESKEWGQDKGATIVSIWKPQKIKGNQAKCTRPECDNYFTIKPRNKIGSYALSAQDSRTGYTVQFFCSEKCYAMEIPRIFEELLVYR